MKNILRVALAASFAFAAALATRSPAHASDPISFTTSCSKNDPDNVATGAQLFVTVSDPGGDQVTFHFYNTGPNPSSISEIYFDDGSLLGIASITNGPGVVFVTDADPLNLPAGEDCKPPFEVSGAAFRAEATPPPPFHGVNPDEWVEITFDLQAGMTFDDVIAELGSGELRMGMHVIAFEGGGSESFINDPPTAVSLASFGATGARGQVTLDWRTGSESNSAGFNLYRATSANGQRVKVNAQLIAAQSSGASGSSYSASDRPGYGSFYYWLEDVDYTGQSTLHDPILVQVRAAVQRPHYRPALPARAR
jgi:hypothetical protein